MSVLSPYRIAITSSVHRRSLPLLPNRFLRILRLSSTMANIPIKLNDGNTIPAIGFGTGTALYGKDASSMIATAIKAGFTHFDGAQVYANEDSLGAGIIASGKPRSELFITTKLTRIPDGQTVRDTLVESLKKLQINYVDLFLIHTPVNHVGKLKETWKEVEAMKKEGLAKSIGVSNFSVKSLTEILQDASIVPAVNQIEFHPHVYLELKPLLEFQAKHGIVTESYGGLSPLFRSQGSSVTIVIKSIVERLSKSIDKPVTEAHILLLWLRQKGIVAITTSKNPERVKEYIAVADLPDLTGEDIAAIDEAGSEEHHRHFTRFFD
ncbi:Aldo/keto reductase [Amylostereum chailletii]|nr:Aldo/keto reductase [Amylostereum chailletii]